MNASVHRLDVSVVIATFRRPDLLTRCLAALCAQSLDGSRYEIVVADDGAGEAGESTTRAIVDRCRAATCGAPAVRYLPVVGTQGPAGARNAGWKTARGRVVAFTDDDTIPDVDWLREGLAALDAGHSAVGGAIRMPLPPRPTDYERDAAGLARAEFATANCLVRRDALVAVGGFDERFTAAWREDSDLHFALLDAGFRVGHAAGAIVVHPVRPAPFGVSVPQQKKVLFDALLFKKHRRLYRTRIRSSPPWLYLATVASSFVALAGVSARSPALAALGAGAWLCLTLRFALLRLAGTSRSPAHVLEMLWTSIAIPPLALWWRLVGSIRFRVAFL